MSRSQVLHLTQDPTPCTAFFCISQVNSALTDLSFCIEGGLAVAVAMDPECGVYKQTETIVCDSLLLQEYELNSEFTMHNDNPMLHYDKHNDKHIANGSHLSCNSKQ